MAKRFYSQSMSILITSALCLLGPVSAQAQDVVLVSAGTFIMGDGAAPCGSSEHSVTLTNNFYLGQYEVTNQEYRDALQWAYDNGYVITTSSIVEDNMDGSTKTLVDLNPSQCEISFSGGTFTVNPGRENYPMVMVSWWGAAAFCDWISMQEGCARAYDHSDWSCNGDDSYGATGYRLPTDAEWEYAAQYNDERIYPWGNESPDCSRANYYGCVGDVVPVGSYPAAPASLGLYDMATNVWEWCNDWHVCNLGTGAVIDPSGPSSGSTRVLRSGAWADSYVRGLRCSERPNSYPPTIYADGGFRIARTHSPGTPTGNASWGEVKQMFR